MKNFVAPITSWCPPKIIVIEDPLPACTMKSRFVSSCEEVVERLVVVLLNAHVTLDTSKRIES